MSAESSAERASSDAARALELAYRFLGRRERTAMEVRSRLERAALAPQAIEGAIGELRELGYIDDERYARLFTEDRRTLDRWGSDRIARSLRERGVDADLIEAALREAGEGQEGGEGGPSGEHGPGFAEPAPVDDLGRAVALLGERFPAGPGSDRDRNRAFGVLARKGYESEIAADAVRAWARGART